MKLLIFYVSLLVTASLMTRETVAQCKAQTSTKRMICYFAS